jgi:hypothetical protein
MITRYLLDIRFHLNPPNGHVRLDRLRVAPCGGLDMTVCGNGGSKW